MVMTIVAMKEEAQEEMKEYLHLFL